MHPQSTRVIAATAKAVGLAAVFIVAAGGGAILHLGFGAPRRFAAKQVSALLAGTFKGRIVVQRVGALRVTGFGGVDGLVFDPEGHPVLVLRGVRARFATATMLRSLLGKGPLVARIPELAIDDAEVVLDEDAKGDLGLVRAFDVRAPSSGGSGTDVSIQAITLRHAWVHGHMAAVPVLDADVDDFNGAFVSTPDTTNLDVAHLFVRDRGHPGMNPEGSVEASVVLPADPNGETKVSAHYDGRAGEIPIRVDGSLIGKIVTAVADVPETAPAAIIAIAPGLIHLGAPVTVHAEVHGELPILRPVLHVRIGAGEVVASAVVTLPEAPRTEITASASVSAKDLDLSVLQEGAPASDLSAALEATVVSRPGGKVSGTFYLASEVGAVRGEVVPAVDAEGDFTESSVRGSARVAERGVPTIVHFSLKPRLGSESPDQLAFRVDATAPDLDAIPRAGPIGRGRAHLVAEGSADLHAKIFKASAHVELADIDVRGVQLAHGFMTASGDGSLESPHVSVRLLGAEMRAGGYRFPQVGATARGTPEALDVGADLIGDDRAPTVAARARLTHTGGLVVQDTRVQITRDDVKSTTRIASVRVAGGTVDIHGMTVDGLGDPISATARISAAAVTVRAKAPSIDLARVAKLLAREEDAEGHLSFDVDATARRSGVDGHVDARVGGLSFRGIHGAAVAVSAVVGGRHLKGEISGDLGKAGKLDVSAVDVTLGGAATDPHAWKTATGSITLDGKVDLQQLLAQIPVGSRPVASATGVVTLEGKAVRPTSAASPLVTLDASTKGLAVVGKQATTKNPDGSVTLGPNPLTLTGIDGSFAVSLAPTTGSAKVTVKLTDRHGPLVSLDAGATLRLPEIVASPSRLLALLADTPLEAKIAIPRRALHSLPPALGVLPVEGDVELSGELSGSARAPRLAMSAKGTGMRARDAAPCVQPVDLDAKVAYDGKTATVHLQGSRDGAEILGVDTKVSVSALDALAGGTLVWEASGDAALTRFPLDAVAPLLDRAISGDVSGKVTLAGLHKAASVDAELDLRALALDRAAFPRGKVRVSVKDGALTASARLDQTDGYLETKATGAIAWGSAVAPALDLTKPVDVSIKAQNFRADAAMPFVQGIFSELDGRIDTDAQLHMLPGGKDGTVKGAITLRDGTFELPQLGERFHGLKGRVIMNPWGTLKFEDFAADAATGHLTASGDAVLQGLALRSAAAQIHIADGQSIPVALEGVPMGRAFGDVKTTAKMSADGKRLDVAVDIPLLHVALPQSTGHSVQALERDKTVRIGVHGSGSFVSLPLVAPEKPRAPSEMVLHAAITLGKDVEVKRDTTVDAVAHGAIDVLVTDKAHVSGKIIVDRGKLELEGKLFTIDHGTVTFLGNDPSNPTIVATAFWDAPSATRVYADFSGPVSSGKLVLRSEPALSQDEILSLVLFGSPDGSFGAQAPPGQAESTGVMAAGVGGGIVTEGLNKAISGITSVDISTRVDTSEANNPRPELAVQITKTVSARLGYKLGVPAPGENPDRTELTLDWRFIRNWSLVAVVGDQGSTALDLVWRMRY